MTATLRGESIGVLGLARSGVAAARLALDRGAHVYGTDAGDSPALREAAARIREMGGTADVGSHDLERLATCGRIVLSPGIPPSAPVLRDPRLAAAVIVPEIEFAFEQLDAPVIAVTGTNGKTTTTSLIHHLLGCCGFDAEVGGNIGRALSEVALRQPPPAVVAVEMSSFQLGRVDRFAPSIGVLTNLAPDHLDWYDTVEAYYADKARLFRNARPADRWVLNGEDRRARELPGDAVGERFFFRIATPLAGGERGGYLSDDRWLTLRLDQHGPEERLLRDDELRILGPHNVANALAAAVAVRLFGGAAGDIAAGLRSFGALPHRMEPVREHRGVLWINDSKATNIASTRVALRSLQRPTVLVLGGRHKGEPYASLAPELRERVRTVLAFGEAAPRIVGDLEGLCAVERVEGALQEVVHRAAALAHEGDAVLLSPACSSYDMFRNFEHRGDHFRELVQEIP